MCYLDIEPSNCGLSLTGYGSSSPHITCEDIERLVIYGVCSFIIALKRGRCWANAVLVDLPLCCKYKELRGTTSCSFALLRFHERICQICLVRSGFLWNLATKFIDRNVSHSRVFTLL